jgi:hypothetical protein
MQVCVVGNGPSAKGYGEQIDACDFVVRAKTWWKYGAVDVGTKVDAIVNDGWWGEPDEEAWKGCEHWLAWTVERMKLRKDRAWIPLTRLSQKVGMGLVRIFSHELRERAVRHIKPPGDGTFSTGFVGVLMAMELFSGCDELHIYGFDGVRTGGPNFADARRPDRGKRNRDWSAEKRALAELFGGTWLGHPCQTKLKWPQMPDLGETP